MKYTRIDIEKIDADDFWDNVKASGNTDECWLWTGGLVDGYGIYQGFRSHRIAFCLSNGEIPEGLNILHTCDNPPCCNPKHLFSGTQKENIQDAINKGRFQFIDKQTIQGEKNGKAKLTDYQVVEIRKRFSNGGVTQETLAHEYNVARSTIANLVREKGFHWNWLRETIK